MKSKVLISIGFGLCVGILTTLGSNPVGASNAAASKEKTYVYKAQPGDSYTQMARKAIQTYGIVNKVKLSGAQIIFAETNITKEAGWPDLNEGQEVNISRSTVKTWVKNAKNIDDTEKLAWNYYVQLVDFDTRNIGE